MVKELKNKVLRSMADLIALSKSDLSQANAIDLSQADSTDLALYDRLKIDEKKVQGMIQSLNDTTRLDDPVGKEKYRYTHPQGLEIINRTAPFGTILIIYESRPDVTVEAAALAFKAGSKILLKGGKEARLSNLFLVSLWHQSLSANGLDTSIIQYLDYTREQTNHLLKSSDQKIDLVVPRGGEALIQMVKSLSTAPVLVSGRGNNFIYVHQDADKDMAIEIILNSKLHKISVCNATDKVLINTHMEGYNDFIKKLSQALLHEECELWGDGTIQAAIHGMNIHIDTEDAILYEEFLAKKIMFSLVDDMKAAMEKINTYSGGHTAVIITEDKSIADHFMENIDAASVIHNASSRYTDGGQFGLGAELAISTDKLHHRGPLGLDQLVTNKWYVYGNGQVRK